MPEPREVYVALVCNADPWTYFGDVPVRPCPDASFDLGLDLLALTRLRTFQTLRHVAQLFAAKPDPHGKRVVRCCTTRPRCSSGDASRCRSRSTANRSSDRAPRSRCASVPNALRVVG